ncbi:nuclease [candidate division KSB1 bacterium]|nr:MAG: nuclease [candidate division KSB1 bacterium]
MEKNLYFYRAVVTKVYDGDTCTVDIDLGLNTWLRNERIRLARINAPEIRGEDRDEGIRSRDFLRALIDGKEIVLQTIKDRKGKYGRFLGEIWLVSDDDRKWLNVNDVLVEKGFAEYVEY